MVDAGQGVGPLKNGVYLDFSEAIGRLGRPTIEERYGNLFEMYERITGESPYDMPMRIYPASHYTMGGLWVDYELMTTVPGLYCAGEANFSDHGANRLGASALMQGLSDGYFVLPYTISNYLSQWLNKPIPDATHDAFAAAEVEARERFTGYMSIGGTRGPDHFHRELGKIIWDYCGMDRNANGLGKALSERTPLPYRLRQDPGPWNALGRIKFMFPNGHDVYLHDTPARALFEHAERGFSSGCIRLQEPLALADWLLADDPRWSAEALRAAIDSGDTRTVNLREPVPVYLLYWTAWVDNDGTVQFRRDIYDRDAPLAAPLAAPIQGD